MENTRPEEEKIIKDTFRIIKRMTCFYDLSYILKNKQDIYIFFQYTKQTMKLLTKQMKLLTKEQQESYDNV